MQGRGAQPIYAGTVTLRAETTKGFSFDYVYTFSDIINIREAISNAALALKSELDLISAETGRFRAGS
jgi:hypothetical protein